MKMANNLLLGILMEGIAETINFGRLGGLSLETLLEVVLTGPLACPLFEMKADMMREMDYPATFSLKHMTKDLKFMVDTAYETGAPIPAGLMMLHLYRTGVARQWGELDFAAIMKILESMNVDG